MEDNLESTVERLNRSDLPLLQKILSKRNYKTELNPASFQILRYRLLSDEWSIVYSNNNRNKPLKVYGPEPYLIQEFKRV